LRVALEGRLRLGQAIAAQNQQADDADGHHVGTQSSPVQRLCFPGCALRRMRRYGHVFHVFNVLYCCSCEARPATPRIKALDPDVVQFTVRAAREFLASSYSKPSFLGRHQKARATQCLSRITIVEMNGDCDLAGQVHSHGDKPIERRSPPR
jgi:hypothetical protein